jgi:hypothetical protein
MSSAHPNPTQYTGAEKEKVPVPYVEHVWAAGFLYNPDGQKHVSFIPFGTEEEWAKWKGRAYPRPWKRGTARIEWAFPRYGVQCIFKLDDPFPLSSWRWAAESALQGDLNGIGNSGFDIWPLPRMPDGLSGGSHMGPSASFRSLVSPGPEGPAPTERYEMFREGMQVCEAIVYLQKALEGKTLSQELTDKVERSLDERARYYVRSRPSQEYHWWALNTGWQEREERLFALCAEVAGTLK